MQIFQCERNFRGKKPGNVRMKPAGSSKMRKQFSTSDVFHQKVEATRITIRPIPFLATELQLKEYDKKKGVQKNARPRYESACEFFFFNRK